MGLYDRIPQIHLKILKEEAEYGVLKEKKINASTLSEEKTLLLEVEKKKAYIEGMKAALKIIQG